jgi:hypothetical protein
VLGAFVITPVVLLLLVFLTWQGHVSDTQARVDDLYVSSSSPVTAWMISELIVLCVTVVIAAGLVIADMHRRRLSDRLQTIWTVLAVLGAPFGGLAYWLIYCHGSQREHTPAEQA